MNRLSKILLFAICAGILLVFGRMSGGFFQQDEWLLQGKVFGTSIFSFDSFHWVQYLAGYERIIGTTLNSFLYKFFPFNIFLYTGWAIFFHALNAALLYYVVHKVTKSSFVSIFSTALFAFSATSHQAVTWIASIFTTLPSATMTLLALLLLFNSKKDIKWIKGLGIFFLSVIAFLFKESASYIFLLIPFGYFLFDLGTQKKLLNKLTYWIPFLSFFVFIVFMRIKGLGDGSTQGGLFVSTAGSQGFLVLLHAVFYPLISIFYMFVPPVIASKISDFFVTAFYGFSSSFPASQKVTEILVPDIVALLFAVVFFTITTRYLSMEFSKNRKLTALFALVWLLISFSPFAVLDRGVSSLDSRYFYIPVMAWSIVVATIFRFVIAVFEKKSRFLKYASILFITVVSVLFVGKNIQLINRDVTHQSLIANDRKSILYEMKRQYPNLPARAVVYMEGNSMGFYGIPELKVPFQEGMGYTIMTWYGDSHSPNADLLKTGFLWRVNAEGYQRTETGGFGYFRDFQAFSGTVRSENIPDEEIIAWFYDAEKKELHDITPEVLEKLRKL